MTSLRSSVPDGGGAGIGVFFPDTLENVVVWRGNMPIRRRELLADASSLVRELPNHGDIINCCRDRYHFLVVFVACLLRGTPAILPNDKRAQILQDIAQHYPGCHFLTDQPLPVEATAMISVAFPRSPNEQIGQEPEAIPLIPSSHPAAIVFSSGSTGKPEPTVRTWQWLATGNDDYVDALGLDRMSGCSIVATVPLQHSYGLEMACMLPLRHSAAVSTAHPLFPADIASALKDIPAPRVLVTTPHHLDVLRRSDVALSKVDMVVSATAPLAEDLARSTVDRLDCRLVEVYGCTEVGLVGARETLVSQSWRPGRSLTIVVEEGHSEVQAPHLPAPVVLDDVLSADIDGCFGLTGRHRDIVKIGGNRMSLEGMNRTLREIGGVEDGVLFQIEDDDSNGVNRVAGVVVLRERELADVRRELHSALPAAFWPRPFRQVDALPRGVTGKIRITEAKALIRDATPMEGFVDEAAEGQSDGQTEKPANRIFVPSDHPSFAGHFPGQPVLPGSVLLEMIVEAAERVTGRQVASFITAKFVKPVEPGCDLRVELGVIEKERTAFRCVQGEEIFASGVLSFRGMS